MSASNLTKIWLNYHCRKSLQSMGIFQPLGTASQSRVSGQDTDKMDSSGLFSTSLSTLKQKTKNNFSVSCVSNIHMPTLLGASFRLASSTWKPAVYALRGPLWTDKTHTVRDIRNADQS